MSMWKPVICDHCGQVVDDWGDHMPTGRMTPEKARKIKKWTKHLALQMKKTKEEEIARIWEKE